jgi:hypothetical protein
MILLCGGRLPGGGRARPPLELRPPWGADYSGRCRARRNHETPVAVPEATGRARTSLEWWRRCSAASGRTAAADGGIHAAAARLARAGSLQPDALVRADEIYVQP